MNPTQRGHQLAADRAAKLRQAATTFGLLLALAVIFSVLLTATCYQQYTLTGSYRRVYEGKIVRKSQTITESQTGSGVRRRLLIEGRGGERFEVAIGADTYERAREGMWIKQTGAGVELSWPMTTTADESPAGETKR